MLRSFPAARESRRHAHLLVFLGVALCLLLAVRSDGASVSAAGGVAQGGQPAVRGDSLTLEPRRFHAVSGAASNDGDELSVSSAGERVSYESDVIQAPLAFSDVGTSWRGDLPEGSEVFVELRTSPDGQNWGAWQPSDSEDIADPRDPAGTTFTSLVAVPQSARTHRFVQARVTLIGAGSAPPTLRDLKLSFIDAGVTTGDLDTVVSDNAPPPAKPPIVTRDTWGAPGGELSPEWPQQYRRANHIIVHHTATLNDDKDFAARVRAIWYYHSVTRKWGDIGYNYLIDAKGTVYEGRAGGDDVAAGHAYPFNSGSVGVALVGDFDHGDPKPAMLASLARLITWKVAQRGIDPLGSATFTGALDCGGTYSVTKPNIAGHRDFRGKGCGHSFNTSTCPGDRLYALLPQIRAEVAAALPPYRAQFEGHTTPQTMVPGGVYTATVTVRNAGSLVWPRAGDNPVHLAFRWYRLDGSLVTEGYRDFRGEILRDMPYGDVATLLVQVGAPQTPGVYNLSWDMVHELVAWFGDRGSAPLTFRVSVAPADNTPPSSRVMPLGPYQQARSFTMQWSGADETGGSGLALFDVQYKAGPAGPWTDWQRGTQSTSAVFTGQEGMTYYFRSRATDYAGNAEAYVEAPDAVTTIDTVPPSLLVTSPAPGQQVRVGKLLVTGASDPDALVIANGKQAAQSGGVFTATLEANTEQFGISVVASDPAGNQTSRTFAVRAVGRFADVPPGHPAFEAVEYLAEAGIISGYDDGTFRPDGNATRAQYTKLLATTFDWPLTTPQAQRFNDVAPTDWAAPYIESAAAQGLIVGYADGSFKPQATVTRAQAVKILVLAAQKLAPHEWRLLQGPRSPFADVPLGHWAYPYVETAYRHGAIQAPPDGRFHPDRAATRAEIALMLYFSLGDLAAVGKAP